MAAAASAALALVGLLFASTILLAAAASLPSPATCSSLLVKFSECIPYVSSPPNKLSDSVSSDCCDAFSSAFESEHCTCLCYLLRHPLLFGFPLDRSRVLSLSSICLPMNASSARHGSLEVLCSGLDTAPSDPAVRSPPPPSLPSEYNDSITPPPSSSAAKQILNCRSWILSGIMIFLVPIFTHL